MKRILNLLGSLGLIASTSAVTIACNNNATTSAISTWKDAESLATQLQEKKFGENVMSSAVSVKGGSALLPIKSLAKTREIELTESEIEFAKKLSFSIVDVENGYVLSDGSKPEITNLKPTAYDWYTDFMNDHFIVNDAISKKVRLVIMVPGSTNKWICVTPSPKS